MRTVTAALVVLLLVATVSTQQQRPQDVELQAAIRTATVDGDLEKAAKLFSGIAEKYKADRATAATALLHLADVYQKRGDAQAKSVYERIVREFSDQRGAALAARARLGTTRQVASAAMSYRRLWSGPKVDGGGTISPDGRLLIVDFAPHSLEFLRTEHAHRRLGFRTDTVSSWLTHAGLEVGATRTIDPPDGVSDERLTVCLWQGHRSAAPATRAVVADGERAEP